MLKIVETLMGETLKKKIQNFLSWKRALMLSNFLQKNSDGSCKKLKQEVQGVDVEYSIQYILNISNFFYVRCKGVGHRL